MEILFTTFYTYIKFRFTGLVVPQSCNSSIVTSCIVGVNLSGSCCVLFKQQQYCGCHFLSFRASVMQQQYCSAMQRQTT